MRVLSTLILAVMITASVISQAPSTFKYQGVLRDASGAIKANANVLIGITIYKGTATGTSVYTESFTIITNSFGLFNLEIGSKNATGFSAIDWANGPYFVKISADNIDLGTSQLLSVPFALYAQKAGNGFSGSFNDLTNKPTSWDSSWTSIKNKPAFKPVATSGIYSDLTNKPDLDTFLTVKDQSNLVTTTGRQTISGTKTLNDSLVLNNKPITNLANPENPQDAATKAYVDALIKRIEDLENSIGFSIVKDIDLNSYKTVVIGKQTWTTSNLKTKHYKDGTAITEELLYGGWADTVNFPKDKYAYYNGDLFEIANVDTFGYLYNYYAVINTKGLCPERWHVSTDEDWTTLINFLVTAPGSKLKETDTLHWASPNTDATNSTGFNALPAGFKEYGGGYAGKRTYASFWSPVKADINGPAYYKDLTNSSSNVITNPNGDKRLGLSVRCVKD
jgi:uncharacterized protein (TIGR02145 family)